MFSTVVSDQITLLLCHRGMDPAQDILFLSGRFEFAKPGHDLNAHLRIHLVPPKQSAESSKDKISMNLLKVKKKTKNKGNNDKGESKLLPVHL